MTKLGITPAPLVQRVSVDVLLDDDPVGSILKAFGEVEYAFVILFVTNSIDFYQFAKEANSRLNAEHIIGTSTAGEICRDGYVENKVVALAFPKSHFQADVLFIDDLIGMDSFKVSGDVLSLKQGLNSYTENFPNDWAFLLVDGLSRCEDTLVSYISPALGRTELFGGSSGDGMNFKSCPIFYNEHAKTNAAMLMIVRTKCRVKIFRKDHLYASDKKLVVTGALPSERLVTEINAVPAAREYARIVGIDPDQLSPFIFAAHPVVVRLGNEHHVRAIQKVENNGDLRFFSAIDEGIVLTIANAENISEHLTRILEGLSKDKKPDLILTCECILRKLEAEHVQEINSMSKQISRHEVYGFLTYGEQHNMMHVNQTITGIAIYLDDE